MSSRDSRLDAGRQRQRTRVEANASGIELLLDPNGFDGRLLLVHRVSFILWFAVMVVHVLGHLRETGSLAPQDWMRRSRQAVPGAGRRIMTIVVSLVIGAALAGALVGQVNSFHHNYRGHKPEFRSPPGAEAPASKTSTRPGT